ncbi:MAG: PIN domain-containing protein [Chloroflexi bacterium]|nr:PIN domain-containing protein [Chloroflexota bacterium]
MTRYLLDTTALIDFSKGREPARSRILEMIQTGDELGVCAVNVAEFYSGLPPENRPTWDEFIGSLEYWAASRTAAARAGGYRYEYSRQGQAISTTDALIAAVAQERGAVIVTNNVKDFPLPGTLLLSL